jgi:hypothetical protein
MSITITAVRSKSTVTFCGAQAIVTGTGSGAGIAMLTPPSVAHHANWRPRPSWPSEANFVARNPCAAGVSRAIPYAN